MEDTCADVSDFMESPIRSSSNNRGVIRRTVLVKGKDLYYALTYNRNQCSNGSLI